MAIPIDRAFVGLNSFQMALAAHAICAGYQAEAGKRGLPASAPLPHILLGVLVVSARSRAHVVGNYSGKTGLRGLMKAHRAVMAPLGQELERDGRTILRAVQFSVEHHFIEVIRVQGAPLAFLPAPSGSPEGRFIRQAQKQDAHTIPLRAARRLGALSADLSPSEFYNLLGVQP